MFLFLPVVIKGVTWSDALWGTNYSFVATFARLQLKKIEKQMHRDEREPTLGEFLTVLCVYRTSLSCFILKESIEFVGLKEESLVITAIFPPSFQLSFLPLY